MNHWYIMQNFLNIGLLVAGIAIEVGVLCWIGSVYFVRLRKMEAMNDWQNRIGKYLLFAVFVFAIIPIGMFYPLWLASVIKGFEETLEFRMTLIAIGCMNLIFSLGYGWRRSKRIA